MFILVGCPHPLRAGQKTNSHQIIHSMGKKPKAGRNISSGGLLHFIWQHRVSLVAVTAAALVISVIVSLLITPRYRSEVILYPASFTSLSRTLTGPVATRGDIMSFGLESDAERLLQVLHSETIRERIIDKYNLMEHYGISESSRYPRTALNRKYNNNVRAGKTQYMAVSIEVLDTDPVIAAAIANDIAAFADSVMNAILRDRAQLALHTARSEYQRVGREVRALQDSLRQIAGLGVIHYETQSEVLTQAYAEAVLNRDTAGIEYFRSRLNNLTEHGSTWLSLNETLDKRTTRLNELKGAYDDALINAEAVIPYKFIIDEASVAEKKSYPVRSLIVAVSVIAAFLFTLFALVLSDAIKRELPAVSKKHGKDV